MCAHIHCCYPFLDPAQRRGGQAVARPKRRGVPAGPKMGQVVAGPKEKRGPGRPWLDPKEIGNWVEARPKEKWVLPPQKEWVLTGPKGIWAEA